MGSKHIHILSHTHWDREWYLNSKFVNEWLVPFFDALFDRMERQRDYRFILDGQTLIIEDLLDEAVAKGLDTARYRQKIKHYVEEKRLFIGPYYMQPDWQLASEEALVRNLLYGQKIAAQYGGAMKSGWLLDNFGQISQAAQIHRGFDLRGLFVWRGIGMDPEQVNIEFEWQSPDGSSVTAICLLGSYRNAMRLADSADIFNERVFFEAAKLEPFVLADHIPLMNGYDQEMNPDDILPLIQAFKREGYTLGQSTPEDYLAAVWAQGVSMNRLRGQQYNGRFVSVFPGILSSRMYIKQRNDALQRLAERYVEPIGAIVSLLGGTYPARRIEEAWKLLLKNLPHDSICGVSIDDVYTDMGERWEAAERILESELADLQGKIAGEINTAAVPGAAAAFVVFNTLPFDRDQAIFIPAESSRGWRFVDPDNAPLDSVEIQNGYRVFVKGVPSLGYKTIYAKSGEPGQRSGSDIHAQDTPVLENPFVRVEIRRNGSLSVLDKATGSIYRDLLIFEDGADSGDEYNYSPIQNERLLDSTGAEADIRITEYNRFRQTCRIEMTMDLPARLTEDRKSRFPGQRALPLVTWVTLDRDSPVIRFRTELRNTVKDHRLRVIFPTDVQTGESYSRTQFDVSGHPVQPPAYEGEIPAAVKKVINGAYEPAPAETFPQLSFAGLEDGQKGAAVFNRGLPEYQIIPKRNSVALTLFRAVGSVARGDLLTRVGDAGPAISTPDAQCLRDMTFIYGFYPYQGNRTEAGVTARADVFLTDTLIWRTGIHNGVLPPVKQFFSLEGDQKAVALSCLKRAEDNSGIIIRLYNNTETPAGAELKAAFAVTSAELTALDESTINAMAVEPGGTLRLDIGAKKIMTVKLVFERQNILRYRENAGGITVREAVERPDFAAYESEPVLTWDDVEREERRAAGLEAVCREKTEAAQSAPPADPVIQNEAILAMETVRRESLEARLSAMLLRKNYFSLYCKDDAELRHEIAEYERKTRELGLDLNRARIAKRAREYILDYYKSRRA